MCQAPGVSPALVAAILKEESGFNPDFTDPATDSYGIGGWTPAVLWHYTDPPVENLSPGFCAEPCGRDPRRGALPVPVGAGGDDRPGGSCGQSCRRLPDH